MISKTSNKLEKLDFVKEAGAAPTDIGNIPCFQVKLTHGAEMNDKNQKTVENTVKTGMEGSWEGEIIIQSSKEIIDESTNSELPCFWVFVYGSLAEITINGMNYHVVEWSEQGGLTAVPTGHTDPMTGIDRFRWSEVSWRPDEMSN